MKLLIISILIVGFVSHIAFGSIGLFVCHDVACHPHSQCDVSITYSAACLVNLHNFNFSLYQSENYQGFKGSSIVQQESLLSWLSLHEHSPSLS